MLFLPAVLTRALAADGLAELFFDEAVFCAAAVTGAVFLVDFTGIEYPLIRLVERATLLDHVPGRAYFYAAFRFVTHVVEDGAHQLIVGGHLTDPRDCDDSRDQFFKLLRRYPLMAAVFIDQRLSIHSQAFLF